MPIAGGILVAGSASRCLSSAAGMLRFLARLSGRRRHVRRSCVGPGGASCCGATGAETGASSVSACVTPEGGSIGGDMGRPTIASAAMTTTTMTTASTTTTTTTARARTTMTTTTTTTTTTSRTTTTMSSSLTSRLDEAAESPRPKAWRNETIERIEDYTRTRSTFVAGPDCTSCRENDRLTLADPLRDDKPHRATRQSQPNSQGSTTLLVMSRKDETKRPEGADNILEEASTSRRPRPKNTRRSNKHSDIGTTPNVDTVVNTATTTATTTTTTSFHTTTTTTSMRTRNDEDDDDDTAEHGSGEISHVRDTITRDRRKYRIPEKDPVLEKERRETATERKRDSDNSSFSNTSYARRPTFPPYLATLLIISYTLCGIADACSSRSTPKPRPPTPTPRPNITFHMYTCPPDYAEWYCLNGATCFTVKIQESLLYNCLCANGFIGQRCEFKDLDGSYLPSRQRVMLETASIAGGATIAVFLVVIICIAAYIHCKRKQKELRTSSTCVDTVDGPGRDPELRPFSNRSRSLMIFMAKNPNGSTMSPSIEQTRMPGWSDFSQTETARMASVNEEKRGSSQ